MRQVDPIQRRNFRLIISAPHGRLDHAERAGARIAFVFHCRHAGHPGIAEKLRGQRGQLGVRFGRRCATGGTADLGRPRTNLVARERCGDVALRIDVLQAEVDAGIRAFGPLLHHHIGHDRQDPSNKFHSIRRRFHAIGFFELPTVAVVTFTRFDHHRITQTFQRRQFRRRADADQ